jgi:amino acid permease
VIGTGVFSGNGEALFLSGPLGLLLTIIVLGFIAICVGETISELVQVWAVPNAIYEYISAFVDRDLAAVVAVLYWYVFPLAGFLSSRLHARRASRADDGAILVLAPGMPSPVRLLCR